MNLGQDSLIFGLDTNRMRVLDPNQNFELMSYCTPLWISKFTYDGVRTAINNTFSGPVSGTQGPTADYLVVRGTVDFKNDTADFIPFGVISSTVPPPVPPTGDYTLQLQDAGGSPIQSISFEPTEYHAFGGADPEFGTFIIPVPADTDIKQAVVFRNGATLTSISASLNPPSVQVIFPNGGENLSEDPVVIEWSGSDLDGDGLTYLVQYSADGGATWETLVADWPDESYETGLNFLTETTQGLIMVMASDGFNSATDESDGTFSVPNHQPEVWILSPPENTLFTGVQTIFFEALAQDREDGSLSGSSIQWMSGIDGFLGTGDVLNKDASTLSEGNHVITVSATDSGGLTATATVNIRVFRIAPVNNPPVADAGPDQTIDAGPGCMTSVALDGSGSSDPDGDPLTYTWTNSFGAVSSPTPTVTLPLGTHTITLTVDDGKGGTASDTVDITVEDTTSPAVNITFPPPLPFPGVALQDGVTFTATASDNCGVAEVYFSVREPGATDGIDLTATFNTTSGNWECDFDTTLLPDGYYVLLAKAVDENGNEGWSELVPFSIRNWAVIEFLPASKTYRAGRTMPVKFSLRIAPAVDPARPFVYNEELEIRIYKLLNPDKILQQTSLFGDISTDYRINTDTELYITNFKTSKKPAEYLVEIWRLSKNFLIGSFTFETKRK
jgi:PKD domain-containing protein/Big-like domain-containing protein